HMPAPTYVDGHPLQALVTNLDASPYLGRLAVCRVTQGHLRRGAPVAWCRRDGTVERAKAAEVFVAEALDRAPAAEVGPGEIVSVAGIEEITIGETLADPDDPRPLPLLRVDEPSLSLTLGINTSPLAGKGTSTTRGAHPGQAHQAHQPHQAHGGRSDGAARRAAAASGAGTKLTARLLQGRLEAELVGNVSIRVLPTERPDTWEVQGRGELALAVLVETMRREGFELTVGKPQVLTRMVDGRWCEPVERLDVDTPEEHLGTLTQVLAQRKGRLEQVVNHGTGWVRMEYLVPARGLIGIRTEVMTQTRGTAQLHHAFERWEPWAGELRARSSGSLVADRQGVTTTYALMNLQERGTLFVGPGETVYEGMIVGESSRGDDMDVNPTKERKLTNMRSSTAEELVRLSPPRQMTLEAALELIAEDECVEVTPGTVRLRKAVLPQATRARQRSQRNRAASEA
ncbi:MAG: translational GTPase TypA, partial [Acidimicrobiales bacterium]